MDSRVIRREGNIISRGKIEQVYMGINDVSSHLLLVPANGLVPKLDDGEYVDLDGDGINGFGVQSSKDMNYARVPVFEHCGLDEYASQLRARRGEIPSVVISRHSARLYGIHESGPTIDDHPDVYQTVLNNWAFPKEVGMGRHYLQIAYVDEEDGLDRLPDSLVLKLMRENPLSSLRKSRKEFVPERRMQIVGGNA